MTIDYLEQAKEFEKYAEEQVKRNVFAAKIFRFIFKDVLDKLIFIREIRSSGIKWYLCKVDFPNQGKLFYATQDKQCKDGFFLSMEFSKDQIDRVDRYFPSFTAWKEVGASKNDFSYKEFPLKTMLESAIGNTILQLLDTNCSEPLSIYLDDYVGNKTLFFKTDNIEEILLRMDLETNVVF